MVRDPPPKRAMVLPTTKRCFFAMTKAELSEWEADRKKLHYAELRERHAELLKTIEKQKKEAAEEKWEKAKQLREAQEAVAAAQSACPSPPRARKRQEVRLGDGTLCCGDDAGWYKCGQWVPRGEEFDGCA